MDNGLQPLVQKPLFQPQYLNIEYVFAKVLAIINPILHFFSDGHTWQIIGYVSMSLSVVCIAIILYSLVRMREIQLHEKEEIKHEIHEALARDSETNRNENPRWHYVLTLTESPSESDWRVAIIEADTMLEEVLRERGYSGTTMSDLLEAAKTSGLPGVQNAWEAHIVRNQIAHQGSNFSLTQIEGRRVIKMYQNIFEDLQVI